MAVLDLTDQLARFPIAYGWQPVRGWPVKHYDTTLTQTSQRTKQHALGEGPWDGIEGLWADSIVVPDYIFHPGIGADAPDAKFPSDAAHPWTSYISATCPAGLSDSQTDALFGIYRTLRTGNYNASGQQLNAAGSVVTPSDPRDEYFFKPNPANVAADQLLRWGKRLNSIINWPAWVDWRDYNDTLIPWDDAAYSPRSLSLTPTFGGSLTPGNTYYIRVSAMKGADESSASLKTLETKANSITLAGGQTAVQVVWRVKGDDKVPIVNPTGITGYRVYIGTVAGTWLGYFTVTGAAIRSLLITTTAGTTGGSPLDLATSGLLRNIKRFECGLFFIPPYDLAQALDKICQISCADWQWSGLGTGTYRNDKVRFLSPATRTPVFTLNLAETGMGSFRTYPVDRRNRANQIIVNFRDRDDEFLGEAMPVVLNRDQLQIDDKQVKPFTIEGGSMYRSQAQRCASFYARVLCDMDQMATLKASPKTYHVLPGDTINITHETPDWTDITFMVRRKSENVEGGIGDDILAQLYTAGLYSDTDYSPLPRPLPPPRVNPFDPPPVVVDVTLTQRDIEVGESPLIIIDGLVQFAPYPGRQRGRVWWWKPGGAGYELTSSVLTPNPLTLQAMFELRDALIGLNKVKVVTESELGVSLSFATHPEFTINLLPALSSQYKIFDNVPPRDSLDGLALTFGIAPVAGTGYWGGASIYRDRGYGYERIGRLTGQATMGHTADNSDQWLGDGVHASPTNRSGVSFSGYTATKTSADVTWGNSGFSSIEAIVGDGFIEWTVTEVNKYKIVGLSTTDPDTNYTSEQYAFSINGGSSVAEIYESGAFIGAQGAVVANTTKLKIARAGTTLTYWKDDVLKRTVTGVTTAPLFVDVAIFNIGATVGPITMSPGAGGVVYFVKEAGPDPALSATLAEVLGGKNNFFVGREKIGVKTFTNLGSGLFKGTDLVRGLNHTEIFFKTHTAQENMLLLNEAIGFIPIEFRDIGVVLSIKVVSFGLANDFASNFTPRGDSWRAYAVDTATLMTDGSNDTLVMFNGNARDREWPAVFHVQCWASTARINPATNLKRTLPVTEGTAHAALLVGTIAGYNIIGGEGGHMQ